ncbi:MAG: hypothetical protein ACM3ZA_02230 [Bacillota bacterium]
MRKLAAATALVGAALAAALLLRPTDPIALLVVEENAVGLGGPSGAALGRPVRARVELGGEAAGPSVRVTSDLLPLGRKTRVLVYQSRSSGFDIVGDSLWQVRASPFRIPVGGTAGEPQAGSGDPWSGIPDVELKAIQRDGSLLILVGTSGVTLRPGEQWSGAWLVGPDGIQTIAESNWDQTIREAVAGKKPLLVRRLTHVGWVPRSRVSVLAEPAELEAAEIRKEGDPWDGGWLRPLFWRWRWQA